MHLGGQCRSGLQREPGPSLPATAWGQNRLIPCVRALRDIEPPQLRDALDALDDDLLRRRLRHVVTENARVLDVVALLTSGADPRRIGPVLIASHTSMRDDFEITVPEVDTAVTAALRAGAHGARMTGGGFGGCVLALVDEVAVRSIVAAAGAAFDRAGFRPPTTFPATAHDRAPRCATR